MLAWRLLRGFVGERDILPMHGVNAKYYDGTVPLSQAVPNTTFYAVKYNYTGPDQRCYDTDRFHPHNTESNLAGTVAKTAASAVIVGTGTSFTSALQVGDVIRVAGGETYTPELFVVKTITDNTHFTAYRPAVHSASGVTGVKDSTAFVVPPGLLPASTPGKFTGRVNINFRANATGIREINIAYNGVEAGVGAGSNSNMDEQDFGGATPSGEWADTIPWGPTELIEGDYVQVIVYQSSGGSLDIAADLPGIPFSMWLVGT